MRTEHDREDQTRATGSAFTGAGPAADGTVLRVMSSRLRKLSIWLALVAYCLTGVVSARGLVLCLEPDGHLSLEAQAAGCASCCSTEDEPEDARERLVSCPCVDVPIGGPEAVQLRVKSADLGPVDACARASFRATESRSHRARLASAVPRVLASSALAQQRTVVLLV